MVRRFTKKSKKLEHVWAELEIDAVDVGVKIDVNKMFGLKIPQDLKDKADSIQKFIDAGRRGDRNMIFNTVWDLKRQEKKTAFHPSDFLKLFKT